MPIESTDDEKFGSTGRKRRKNSLSSLPNSLGEAWMPIS
jgi:hypothetical protein